MAGKLTLKLLGRNISRETSETRDRGRLRNESRETWDRVNRTSGPSENAGGWGRRPHATRGYTEKLKSGNSG
jgi:hypothetical protein